MDQTESRALEPVEVPEGVTVIFGTRSECLAWLAESDSHLAGWADVREIGAER